MNNNKSINAMCVKIPLQKQNLQHYWHIVSYELIILTAYMIWTHTLQLTDFYLQARAQYTGADLLLLW